MNNCQSRLVDFYKKEVVPKILQESNLKNKYQVPKLTHVVLSMGCSTAQEVKSAVEYLTKISGQKAVPTFARKSIVQFSIREGNENGAKVTLRRNMMYHFIDRFLNISLLRYRDFERLNEKVLNLQSKNISFSVGIPDIRIFCEVKIDSMRSVGCNVTFCTNGEDQILTLKMLQGMGFPLG